MPTTNFRAFYRGLDNALGDLYSYRYLPLVTGENGANSTFDSKVFERAAEWIREKGEFTPEMLLEKPAQDLIAETFRILDGAITDSISGEMPDDLVGILENNAFTFSGFKGYHSLSEIGLLLTDGYGGIKPFEKFREDVGRIDTRYNRNYLEAEYNQAVASSQMASKWHDFERDGDRYDLQYRTAGDGDVRPEHAAMNGITLPSGDPFWTQFTPPNGWNCRCTVVQVLKGKYRESDSDEAIERGDLATAGDKGKIFRYNPGKELKVFPDKHPYYKAPSEAKEAVGRIVRERADGLRKQTDAKVREWFRDNMPGNEVVRSEAFETGEVKLSAKSLRRYLGHARTNEAKWMLKNALDRPEDMKHVGISPLGATKDMGNPAHVKNVEGKVKRNVVGYNLYEFKYRDETWLLGFERIAQGNKLFEQPYYIKKQKS